MKLWQSTRGPGDCPQISYNFHDALIPAPGRPHVSSTAPVVDDVAALPARRPASPAEVGEVVREAAAAGNAVYPVGGRTALHLGLPPARPGLAVDLTALDQVLDYPARDMTITVQAGLTIAALQTVLASERQRLPIDVPHAERATVGGILAVNASGPRRFGWGTLRDYVIGITVINDEGQETRAGGRVVKNVAGYDLCKLHVGALGTLGIISQVTFKLRPLPEEQGLFAFACAADQVEAALALLHQSRTRPVCIELLNPELAMLLAKRLKVDWQRQWSIVVGYEDSEDALKWQVQQLIHEVGGAYNVGGLLGSCANPVWQELIAAGDGADAAWAFKASVLPSRLAAYMSELDGLMPGVRLLAHAGNGIVVGLCDERGSAEAIGKARTLAAARGGHLVGTRCPAAWRRPDFIWGPARADTALMHAVKRRLDPRDLFNPGRLPFPPAADRREPSR